MSYTRKQFQKAHARKNKNLRIQGKDILTPAQFLKKVINKASRTGTTIKKQLRWQKHSLALRRADEKYRRKHKMYPVAFVTAENHRKKNPYA